jgi:hypothetical protein
MKTLNLVLDLSGMPVQWLSYLPTLSSWTVAIQGGHALMHRGASSKPTMRDFSQRMLEGVTCLL